MIYDIGLIISLYIDLLLNKLGNKIEGLFRSLYEINCLISLEQFFFTLSGYIDENYINLIKGFIYGTNHFISWKEMDELFSVYF